jgi:hypothetical protein
MKKLLFATATVTLLGVSFFVTAKADPDAFQACVRAGNPTDECAVCTNPSRGGGTSGSTAVCLCNTQLVLLGQEAFNATYGNFGKCVQLEHAHGVQ